MDLPAEPDELASSVGFQLTAAESAHVEPVGGRVKAKLLTTLWTVKEGFTKATGDGVSFGLDRIEVELGDGSVSGVRVDGRDVRLDGWTWAVGSIEAGEYGYAVIWRGENEVRPVQVERVEWDDFVRIFLGTRT
jgi:4'-phosphopantetheinyl transferase